MKIMQARVVCSRIKAVVVAAYVSLVIGPGARPALAEQLTTLDSAGTPLSTFSVGLAAGQFIPFIAVDASGNIWVGISDAGHSVDEFSPNDMVAKFTPTGTALLTVKGPMRAPSTVAVDSMGNIYVGGLPDGGSLSAHQIYKYDSNGVFLTSFGEQTGALVGATYFAFEFASGDRLFATTNNPHRVIEFTTGGVQVNDVGSFDAANRFGRGLALSPDGSTLWNYQPKNGPGEDFIASYDLDLALLSSFGLGALGGFPPLFGLDTLQSGNLVARKGSTILELSPTGTLISVIDFSSIDPGTGFLRGFTVDNNGNFLVTHAAACGNGMVEEGEECDVVSASPSGGGGSLPVCVNCRLFDEPLPAVSEWGLIVMGLLGLTIGTVLYGRRPKTTASVR